MVNGGSLICKKWKVLFSTYDGSPMSPLLCHSVEFKHAMNCISALQAQQSKVMLVYCLLLWPIALKKYSISTCIILVCLGSRTNQLLFTYLCISAYIFGWFIIPWIVFEKVESVLVVPSGISGQNKTKKGSPDYPFERNAFLELHTNDHLVNSQQDIQSQITGTQMMMLNRQNWIW